MIRLNIVGDFMPIDWLEKRILQDDMSTLLCDDLKAKLQQSDLNILNLECPLTQSTSKNLKTGKNFKTKPDSIKFLKQFQFGLVCLANNHSMDFGIEGMEETIETCHTNNISLIGVQSKCVRHAVHQVEKDGVHLSIINAAEQEFGAAELNEDGYLVESPEILVPLIHSEKNKGRNVLLILHGGREFYELPTPQRQARYRLYIDMGADAIVSHHTHVPSGVENYNGKPIVYSLGNFMFPFENHSDSRWYQTLVAHLEVSSHGIECKLSNYRFDCSQQKLRAVSSDENEAWIKHYDDLNEIIHNSDNLQKAWNEYIEQEVYQYLFMMNFFTRIRYKLYLKGYLKAPPISEKKLLVMLNLLRCEAHRVEAIDIIKSKLNQNPQFIN